MPAKRNPNELHLTRVYDAPLTMVWEAWTDPKQAAHWWGPRGFTITTKSKDFRVGGNWDYTMHGPDGTDYPNVTKYLEIEKHSKLVYDHGGNADQPPLFRVTVFFLETKGKTKIDMTMAFASPEVAIESKKFIKGAGGNSTWDRLAEYLAEESAGKKQFVINRTFSAPIETLYDMWTSPKHFSKWLPPTGFTMEILKGEIKEGQGVFYKMSGAGGAMYGRTSYLELRRPDHLSYTQQFCDENENIARHPMSPTWPETMLTRVQLAPESNDTTRVTVTWEPYGNATREEIETFMNARAGMTQGWSGSFEKLDSYIAEATGVAPGPDAW